MLGYLQFKIHTTPRKEANDHTSQTKNINGRYCH